VYTPETSCLNETSVHIKNTQIKQSCNQMVWHFATASRVQKLFRTIEKQASELRALRTLELNSERFPVFVLSILSI